MRGLAAFSFTAVTVLVSVPATADMRGHGGPVRALAIAESDGTIASGSFDTTLIVWDEATGAAREVLRLHEDSVNAAAFTPDGRIVTAGQDGRIGLFADGDAPVALGRHEAPAVAVAVAPDGASVATASWDGTVRVTPLGGGEPRVLSGHDGNVNAVAYLPDGRLVSAGYDMSLRLWPAAGEDGPAAVIRLNQPLNALAVADDGEIVAAGADGMIRFFDGEGDAQGTVETVPVPITALALSQDGSRIASASIDGSVWIIDREARAVTLSVQGADSPVWSLAFDPDDGTLFAGGGDRVIRQWNPETGERIDADPGQTAEDDYGDSRGAEVFAACSACHTVTEDGGNRAGPTLHGIFGRRIASVEDYTYSEAFYDMDIVWTPETVAELFDVGPNHYTPGTKMPEQRIANADDRAALIAFLKDATE